MVWKQWTFLMEIFNGDEKIYIFVEDFKWCEYNVHINAPFIMVIKTWSYSMYIKNGEQ